jgi:hypothetical protein
MPKAREIDQVGCRAGKPVGRCATHRPPPGRALRKPSPGPRFARPEDKLRGCLEGRAVRVPAARGKFSQAPRIIFCATKASCGCRSDTERCRPPQVSGAELAAGGRFASIPAVRGPSGPPGSARFRGCRAAAIPAGCG